MLDRAFEKAFEEFLHDQKRGASGQRLEMLNRDLTGTKKLLGSVLWPVLRTFDGMTLEYEMTSTTGVKIYGDVFHDELASIFESEGFVGHAENVTRDRFSFERMRARTIMLYGYRYVPFAWDEMDKKPEGCRRTVYEMLGRLGSASPHSVERFSLYEREVLRHALRLGRPIKLEDACGRLRLSKVSCARVLKSLVSKEALRPLGRSKQRVHAYELQDNVVVMLM